MINLVIYDLNIQLDNLEKQKEQLKRKMKNSPKNNVYCFTYKLLLEDEKKLNESIEKERNKAISLL